MESTAPIEIVFSFDTTGSMYPCLAQVRAKIKETAARLFRDIPGLRVGVIAHGDYCDKGSTYVTSILDLTDDPETVSTFVQGVRATGGGDAPECYELVLREAQTKIKWKEGPGAEEARRVLVVIGDEVPHEKHANPGRIDWREEIKALGELGIATYGVQCLGRGHATAFYKALGAKSGGFHVTLDQFAYVTDLVMAICYQQQGPEYVASFEAEVVKAGRMSRNMDRIFATMTGRETSAAKFASADLRACAPSRFQVMDIGASDCAIKDFVQRNGLLFKIGRGFYEFTKTETIQGYKEIVLMDKSTGDLFEGKAAREMLGLSADVTARIKPAAMEKYVVFVQSTSANRQLVGGTRFLYEVDMSR